MARAAEVLRPDIVLIENVPMVTRDTEKVVETTLHHLRAFGYVVADAVVDLARLGAPQRRRRHVVLASRDRRVDVGEILRATGPRCATHNARTVDWAIRDLVGASSSGAFDAAASPNIENAKRIAWLFDHGEDDLPNELRPECHQSDHSYKSMYGRLKWDEPAQTVTTGFGSMGQGRYVHPSDRRTITPHEAARLQLFPDFWSFSRAPQRGQLASLIGNAAPPALASSLLEPALRSLGLAPSVAFPTLPNVQRPPRRSIAAGAGRSASTRLGVPAPSSIEARNRLRAVRRAGTEAELALRAEVDRLGLGYATDASVLGTRARADLLFEEAGVVVLVDGCYWHGCPLHGTASKANAEWWRQKLAANRMRDERADRRIHDLGWLVLRFWEHEDPSLAAKTVGAVVAERAAAMQRMSTVETVGSEVRTG
jgi:DNA mismatch endonuclease Vsr